MKQQLLNLKRLRGLMLLAVMCIFGAGTAWGDDVLVYTLDGSITGGTSGYATESEITQDDVTWMVMGNTTMSPWRIGGKNLSGVDRPLYSTLTLKDDISKVVVTNGTATLTVNSMTLIVSSKSDFSSPTSTVSGTFNANNTTTFDRPTGADWSNKFFKIVYNVTTSGDKNQYAQFVKAEFYKASSVSNCVAPTFSPAAGTFTSAQDVTISCETSGATIYYTIDGTTPTTSSSVYSSAIPVSQTTTIKAFAAASGYNNSIVASATYAIVEHAGTQEDPYSVADARDAIDAGDGLTGVYATGIVTAIPTEWNTKFNNITFNFIDEGGSDFLQAFRCVSTDNADASEVAVGDIVVVKGNLKEYNGTYEFDAACELVSLTHPTSTDPVINAKATLNLAYDATSGEIAYSIDNSVEGTALSATLQEGIDWITDITVGDESVTFTTTANEGDTDRTATITLSYEGAENVTVTVTQKHYVAEFATLPFEFNGGKADIENTAGLTQSGIGSDYGSAPKLKFDGNGDNVILKIDERPGVLTFDVKGNSFSGGTFTVQTSEDGIEYTDVATYSTLGDTETKTISNLGEDVRYIKWIYTEKVSGNVGLGNIKLEAYVAPQSYTLTIPNIDNVNISASYGTDGIMNNGDEENIEQGTEITLTVDVAEGFALESLTVSGDGEGQSISPKPVSGLEGAYKFTMPAYNATVIATVNEYVAPTGDDYELFSGDLVEGEYIIYYDGKAMNTTVTSDRLQYAEVTPTNDVITTDNAAIVWHIAKSGDYWTLYNAEAEAYAASTGAKNKAQMLEDGTDDRALWTVTCEDSNYEFVNKQNTTNEVNANLRNNGTYGFACYATSTGGALSLYKKVETVPVEIGAAEYATLYYSDKAFEIPEGITAQIVTGVSDKSIELEALESIIPAGTGVVLNGPEGTYDFKVVNDNSAAPENNKLKGYDAPHLTEGGEKYYKLTVKDDKVGFYWGEENGEAFENGAHKAYLALSADEAKEMGYFFDGLVTEIRGIGIETVNGEIYTIGGVRVKADKLQKGIYIVNGKKMVVK